MSDAKLWINDVDSTATIAGTNASYTMPLWAFNVMSEIIVANTLPHFWTADGTLHIDALRMPTRIIVNEGGPCEFVPKRELDIAKAENAKLLELVGIIAFCTNKTAHDCDRCAMNGEDLRMTVPEWLFCDGLTERLRAIGFEVTE